MSPRASMISHLVKYLPVIQETLVWFLGQEDLLEKIGYPLQYSWASLVAQLVEVPAGDLGSIPGLGRYPGEGKCCPLQYSGLENTMDVCIVHGVIWSPKRQLCWKLAISINGESTTFLFCFVWTKRVTAESIFTNSALFGHRIHGPLLGWENFIGC